jgi:hypothetical protein
VPADRPADLRLKLCQLPTPNPQLPKGQRRGAHALGVGGWALGMDRRS